MKRKIELLSPARNAESGIEAIRHGADAVYIGGPSFGARAAAGNSVSEIEHLCRFAHQYKAKVYVALNTILWEDELGEAEQLVRQLYDIHVDALIIQDLSLLKLDLPPIALHASTQMDNRSVEKACFLENAGFSQIVLARELSLKEIKEIYQAVSVPLEAFVHGALCVSYSGQCYASQYCFGRSANRGRCAQFCRLKFDLIDSDGKIVIKDRHLLSLRDMNRSSSLEEMMDAGVSSFKIEGRLKDLSYVKNLTAFYRTEIDRIIQRRSEEFERASDGTSYFTFTPVPEKSFNRGFTDYFLHGRARDVYSFNTPKSIGMYVGNVKQVNKKSIIIGNPSGSAALRISAGDGLCFFNDQGDLEGFRVNSSIGHEIFPSGMPGRLRAGMQVYRNLDSEFEKLLARPSADRKIGIHIDLEDTETGFRLTMQDETGLIASVEKVCEKQMARSPQGDNMQCQLNKLGDTPFKALDIRLHSCGKFFIPSSVLSGWRRECTSALLEKRLSNYRADRRRKEASARLVVSEKHLSYLSNVSNAKAAAFYREHGAESISPAFELQQPEQAVLMFCRHCLKYAIGICPRSHHFPKKWKEPFALRLPDGRNFPLEFDCKNCQMKVHAPQKD